MKKVEVCAAALIKNNKVFITQRGYGEMKDFWEFPGGKIEEGESTFDCIKREVKEELNIVINPIAEIKVVEYDYPTFHIKLHLIHAEFIDENYTLLEHKSAKFLSKQELDNVDFLPADFLLLEEVKKLL